MANLIDELTPEDLIRVVANICDGVKLSHWLDEFTAEDAKIIYDIGEACKKYCIDNDNWELPKI